MNKEKLTAKIIKERRITLLRKVLNEFIQQANEEELLNLIFILNNGEYSIEEIQKNYTKLIKLNEPKQN